MWQAAFGLEHHANGVSLEAGTLFVSADRRSPLLALVAARTACGSEYVRRAMGIFVYVYVCSYFIVVWTYVRINMKQWLLSKRGFYVCVRFGHIVCFHPVFFLLDIMLSPRFRFLLRLA